jgi:hypothetical protein
VSTIFLDASVLFYSKGQYVAVVDYNTPVNDVTRGAAMHSGDQINQAQKSGEHNVVVSLKEVCHRLLSAPVS